jgi:hypothetical protein
MAEYRGRKVRTAVEIKKTLPSEHWGITALT